jgi:hypothetical protein
MRRLIGLTVLLVGIAGSAGAASGDGGPPGGIAGPDGVTVPGSDVRYVTLYDGGKRTTIAAVARNGGQVMDYRSIGGYFEVPGVTTNGSAAGLSADGTTLVLVRQTSEGPQRRSTLLVLNADRLNVSRRIELRGSFAFDALSPDGRSLYLIQYLSDPDYTSYAVRSYDVAAGRLRSKPIVDPTEHADEMRGLPLSRRYSPDGRWAYTLYDGNGKHPFVHALDTIAAKAKCIDLPMLADRRDLYDLAFTIGAGGRRLTVAGKHGPIALVDTRTFRVTQPLRPAPSASDHGGGTGPWPVLGFAALLAAGGAAAVRLRRRRRLATG